MTVKSNLIENELAKKVFNFFVPIAYLTIWFLFTFICIQAKIIQNLDASTFLILSFLVMFFGMITKSTSWSIGNSWFNLSGDSKRHIEYSAHDNWKNSDKQKNGYTIKIDHDNPEVIKSLMSHHAELIKKIKVL